MLLSPPGLEPDSKFCSTLSPGLGPPPWLWLLAAPPLSLTNGDWGHTGPQPRSQGKSLQLGQESHFWENPPSELLNGGQSWGHPLHHQSELGTSPYTHQSGEGDTGGALLFLPRGVLSSAPPFIWQLQPQLGQHLPWEPSQITTGWVKDPCPHHCLDVPITALIVLAEIPS